MPPAGRLRIDRFHAEYVVAASHPDAEDLRWRFDQLVRARLPALLERTLGPWLERGGDAVVLIRELDVDLSVHRHWDGDEVASGWATQIAHAIQRAVQADAGYAVPGEAQDGIACFADRSAYLARFLADLAAGEAWGRWYYRAFDGLKSLPTSAALRTAICDDPMHGLHALLALPPMDRHRVLDGLTTRDAGRVLDHMPDAEAAAAPAEGWGALLEAWRAMPPRAPSANMEQRLALELYLGVARHGAPADASLRARTRALARAARLLGEGTRADALVRALERGGDASPSVGGLDDAGILDALRHAPPGWVAAVARTLAPEPAATSTGDAIPARSTPFGGIFLLARSLTRLPLDEACAGWPAAGATRAAAAMRLVLLAKALGSVRRSRVFWDPLARELAGVHASLTPGLLRAWAAELSPDALAAWVASCSCDAAGTVPSPALLDAPAAGSPLVLADGHTGMWLHATHRGRRDRTRAAERVIRWLRATETPPAAIITDDVTLGRALTRAGRPTLSVAEALATRARDDAALAAVLARRHKLGDELAFLRWPVGELPARADLAFAIVAQRMLRDYAARLPGFHASTASYLFASFLDVMATVERDDARWIVHLGRPPLQYVLALSGTARLSVAIPWLGGVSLTLCQDGG